MLHVAAYLSSVKDSQRRRAVPWSTSANQVGLFQVDAEPHGHQTDCRCYDMSTPKNSPPQPGPAQRDPRCRPVPAARHGRFLVAVVCVFFSLPPRSSNPFKFSFLIICKVVAFSMLANVIFVFFGSVLNRMHLEIHFFVVTNHEKDCDCIGVYCCLLEQECRYQRI